MGQVKEEVHGRCRVWLQGLPVAIPLTEERDSFISRIVQADKDLPFMNVEAAISGTARAGTMRYADVVFVEELPIWEETVTVDEG